MLELNYEKDSPLGGVVGRDTEEQAALAHALTYGSVQLLGPAGSGVTSMLHRLAAIRPLLGRSVLTIDVQPWATAHTPTLLAQIDSLLGHAQAPLVLLDDADQAPLHEVEELAAAVHERSGVLLVGMHPGIPLDGMPELTLPGLSRVAVESILSRTFGAEAAQTPALVSAIRRASNGNPSHLNVLVEHPGTQELITHHSPYLENPEYLATFFAPALVNACVMSVQPLSEPARVAVAALALAGTRAPAALQDVVASVQELQEARTTGLLVRNEDRHDFRHSIVRRTILQAAPHDVRAQAVARLNEAAQAFGFTRVPKAAGLLAAS